MNRDGWESEPLSEPGRAARDSCALIQMVTPLSAHKDGLKRVRVDLKRVKVDRLY